jgi:hypothetical protein
MEIVDNLIIVVIPGAMDAGLGSLLFWGSLAFALAAKATPSSTSTTVIISAVQGIELPHAALSALG